MWSKATKSFSLPLLPVWVLQCPGLSSGCWCDFGGQLLLHTECLARNLSSMRHSCIQGTFPPWAVSDRYWAQASSLKISKHRDFFDRTRNLSPWCPHPSMQLWLGINHHTKPFLSYTIHPSQQHEQGMIAPMCNLETPPIHQGRRAAVVSFDVISRCRFCGFHNVTVKKEVWLSWCPKLSTKLAPTQSIFATSLIVFRGRKRFHPLRLNALWPSPSKALKQMSSYILIIKHIIKPFPGSLQKSNEWIVKERMIC